MEHIVIPVAIFAVLAISSREIGHFLGRFRLPHITGYLLAGLIFGPFVLNLVSSDDVNTLRFVDELSLAVIAFVAGSELYLKELRSRIKPILLNTVGVMIAGMLFIGAAVFLLTETIPFTQGLPIAGRIAVAALGSTILLALSPASTIAVIQEVRAKGPFTRTTLSTTVVMDVAIIVLFAISAALAGALLQNDSLNIGFVALLALDLGMAVLLGLLLGKMLEAILATSWRRYVKTGLILAHGLGVFMLAFEATYWTRANLPFELHVEALLVCMIAGFYVTNFTNQRDQFEAILHDVAPYVYVAFFTLTGIALKLDILLATLGIAAVLFGVRVLAIFVGSFAGGTLAGEPLRFRRIAWMGLITQAGIALGLAREVSVQFPDTLGDAFATLIIAVVVLNEIFGPLFLKFALRQAGEAPEQEITEFEKSRHAVILGVEPQSLQLARQLHRQNWQVTLADTDREHVERMAAEDVDERYVPVIDEDCLATLMNSNTDALVAMLADDAANLRACEIAVERYGVKRMVVRLNGMARAERFTALGALVVDQASAMVNLLDQAVRAPQSAALMLHRDPDYDIVQITVTEDTVDGMLLRDLRLPNDVLILEIARNGHSIVPSGYTKLHVNDEVSVLGKPESLNEVTLKLGY
jgi:Trk K+ transport system NAD-binding subunit/Kef-type K+ transport system membrane component KefB